MPSKKGSVWVLGLRDGALVSADYLERPGRLSSPQAVYLPFLPFLLFFASTLVSVFDVDFADFADDLAAGLASAFGAGFAAAFFAAGFFALAGLSSTAAAGGSARSVVVGTDVRSTAPLSAPPSPEPFVAAAREERRRRGGASTRRLGRDRLGGRVGRLAGHRVPEARSRTERGHRRRRDGDGLAGAGVAAGAGGPRPALEHAEPGERHGVAGPDGVDHDLQQGIDGGGRGLPVAEAVGQRVHELGLVHAARR